MRLQVADGFAEDVEVEATSELDASTMLVATAAADVDDVETAEAVEEDFATHFTRVVLEPWPMDLIGAYSPIELPTIPASSHGKVDIGTVSSPGVEGHAPLHDSITVLLDPGSISMLEDAIGMGLGATWTQIKRDESAGGKKGKGKDVSSFWYMEELVHQIPSFWIDDENDICSESKADNPTTSKARQEDHAAPCNGGRSACSYETERALVHFLRTGCSWVVLRRPELFYSV